MNLFEESTKTRQQTLVDSADRGSVMIPGHYLRRQHQGTWLVEGKTTYRFT